MIKKIILFLFVIALSLTGFTVLAESEVSVNIEFIEDCVEIDKSASLKINVLGNVKKVSAVIDYNNYFYYYTGAGLDFDINTGEYSISFTPSDQPYILYCFASNTGDAEITLKDIVCETEQGNINLGSMTASISVIPEYKYIYTKEDLNNIRKDLSGSYLLMNDIEFTEQDFAQGGAFYNDGFGWIPIGAVVKEAFTGEFNGNGYTISGLTINKAYYNYCGLFGVNKGKITSVRMKDAIIDGRTGINVSPVSAQPSVKGSIDYEDKDVWTEPDDNITEKDLNKYDRTGKSTANVAIICGYNLGCVEKSFASGEIYGNNCIGGIVGRNGAKISLCASNVAIKEGAVGGGIAGIIGAYSNVTDCVSEGEIYADISGAVAGNACGILQRVYSTAKTSSKKACFGVITEQSKISQVYFFGEAESDGISEIKDIEELSSLRFDAGDWNYIKKNPYPAPLADLIKSNLSGDANCDGKVDTVDLAALKLFLVQMGEVDQTNADMNNDGNVNTVDLAALKLKLAGIN